MRNTMIEALRGLDLGSYSVSTELPWNSSGQSLALRNPRVIYVGERQTEEDTVLPTFGGHGLSTRIRTLMVMFANDAKQKPQNYDDLSDQIHALRATLDVGPVYSRDVEVTTTFENDMMLTEFEFQFTELKVN